MCQINANQKRKKNMTACKKAIEIGHVSKCQVNVRDQIEIGDNWKLLIARTSETNPY